MIAVGLLGAFMGSPAIWLLPIIFPLVMAFGAVLGVLGVPVPAVETGIAGSAIVLGFLILFAAKLPIWLASVIVGLFRHLPRLRSRSRAAFSRQSVCVWHRFRHCDRSASPLRHCFWSVGQVANGALCGSCGGRRDCAGRICVPVWPRLGDPPL
jgi:hypothetical protein